jgi:deazaflavin-dependent oxidoreductase (nitroreductase family)
MGEKKRFIRWVPGPKILAKISTLHVWLYQNTRGIVGTRLDGLDILLLTTRGRKTGLVRTAPLPYFRDGQDYVLIGSNGGRDVHPAWYHNLRADRRVQIQVGARTWHARARVVEGEERERIWKLVTRDHPRYDRYVGWTDRKIPVVVLELETERSQPDASTSSTSVDNP